MKQQGFNPKARWDRHIPETEGHDFKDLNQRIEVLAGFRKGRCEPRLFVWNGKTYKIKNVTYHWQERQGQELIHCFSVNTDLDLYEISFHTLSLCWHMVKVISS
ncbi:MAG: hypothetical protein AMJ95_12640 [Omnitrophica WOR_2 bacterium SM23_72]|nr:MAG: hypothetical protein AMJ95_12640 [Omnitrophica WOR_2 bacterium SM23_72]